MKLISVVLLIGVSVATQATTPDDTTVKPQGRAAPDNNASNRYTTLEYPTTYLSVPDDNPWYRTAATRTYYGMAQINYVNSRHFCSGVFLKPWILLTAASCVKGRSARKLSVRVTYKNGTAKRMADLKVHQVKVHPKYDPKKLDYNFAVMSLYSKSDFGAEVFDLPKQNYKTEDIIGKKYKTMGQLLAIYANWPKVYLIRTNERKLNENFRVCNELGSAPNYYCAERGSSKAKLWGGDRGAPLYFTPPGASAKTKELLGIYTGRSLGQYVTGHVFESVFPAVEFIQRFMTLHSVPPYN